MSLEKDKKDVSYQYGRLLAVLEKAERDTYRDEEREPNAIRLMSACCAHPAQTAHTIHNQVRPVYFNKLSVGRRTSYDILICEIFEKLSEFSDAERYAPLKETYLLGYYLQKNDLWNKNKSKNESETETESTNENN